MMNNKKQSGRKTINLSNGFTAVELLITLFIAAMFLASGFQLYMVVIKDGSEIRAQSKANNVAYDYLQRYKPSATIPCTVQTPLSNQSITVPGLSNVTMTVSISCPYTASSSVSKVSANINYGTPQKTITDSTYTTTNVSIGGVSYYKLDETSGTTAADYYSTNNGAVKVNAKLYYPFDGNANDASNSGNNATVSNAALTTDRFGTANSAYSFNGTSSYISTPTMSFGSNKRFYSAWIKVNASALGAIVSNNIQLKITAANKLRIQWSDGAWHTVDSAATLTNGVWYHIALVYDGAIAKLYINGAVDANTASFSAYGGFSPVDITIGRDGAGGVELFNGSIDEIIMGSISTGVVPNAGDIARLYALTAVHDMNKPWVTTGKLNGAIDLWGYEADSNDSVCSYIDMGTGFNSVVKGIATPFTLAFWTYKSPIAGGYSSSKQFGWYGGNYKGAYIGVEDSGSLQGTVGQGNTTGVYSQYQFSLGAGTVTAGQWNHIAITYDGTNVKVYLNGINKLTYNIGAYVDNGNGTQQLIVNKQPWDFYGASQGQYDEMRAWSKALTSTEITSLYNLGM